MGPHCGVCHDRGEEGTPAPVAVWQGEVSRDSHIQGPVTFTPDGRRLLIWRRSHGWFLDLATGATHESFGVGIPGSAGVHFFPDGRTVVYSDAADGGTSLRLIDVTSGRCDILAHPPPPGHLHELAVSPDGHLLVAADRAHVRLWQRDELGPWVQAWVVKHEALGLTFSRDGRTVVAGGRTDGLCFFDSATGQLRYRLEGDKVFHSASTLAYHTGGRRLVVVAGSTRGRPWRVAVRDMLLHRWDVRIDLPGVSCAVLSPDAHFLAAAHLSSEETQELGVWDTRTGALRGWIDTLCAEEPAGLAFSPDGRTIVGWTASGSVRLWPWWCLLGGERLL